MRHALLCVVTLAATLSAASTTKAAAVVVLPSSTLSTLNHSVFVQYGGPGVANKFLSDAVFLDVTVDGSYAMADMAGVLKDSSSVTDKLAPTTFAYSGLEVQFKNTGAAPIAFAAGDISATASASFARTVGAGASGSARNSFTAILSGVGPGFGGGGGASANYQYVESNAATSPFFDFHMPTNFGFTASGTADAASLAVALAFPAFTLAPDQTLKVALQLTTTANAGDPSASGWSALTDAASSGHVKMTLPAGVTLISDVPLPWVTSAVPEPASALLLAGGLFMLVVAARSRRVR